MQITGMKVYKFISIMTMLILGLVLIKGVLNKADATLIMTYSASISATLILFLAITSRKK